MKQSIDLQSIGKAASRLLLRFHVITYAIVVAVSLSLIVYLVSQIVLDGSEPPISTGKNYADFDNETIEQLESLSKRSSDGKPLQFPSNQRINPFSE